MTHTNWRVRHTAIGLLGDLLVRAAGLRGQRPPEGAEEGEEEADEGDRDDDALADDRDKGAPRPSSLLSLLRLVLGCSAICAGRGGLSGQEQWVLTQAHTGARTRESLGPGMRPCA